jgi:type IV fimbrial biogenesis protein FimT
MPRRRHSGFSLIEIMVSIVVLSILIVTGVPMFQMWIQNTQIRTASEAILNGLQVAKNEAIRRNASVQLKIEGGTGWRVNLASDPDGTPLQSRAHEEGSANAAVVMTPGGADTVTFSGLGRIVGNADATPTITQIDIDNPTMAAADSRELRILVPPGGLVRLCDPQVAVGDPRGCNP